MTITWYGQSCFRLESKDIRVLIDPFSKEIGLKPPRINDTIVALTHEHFDHNNVGEVGPETFVIRGPGEYEKSGIQIVGIQSFHDNEGGTQRGYNTIYVIKIEGITVCHLGDFGQHELTSEQLETIGEVDVLMTPIGGVYTIDGTQAVRIVEAIEPKIIIPMHYKVPGLAVDLEGPQKFIKEIGLKAEEVESLKLQQKSLPTEEMLLYTFKL
ncbi:MAG: hypothetical protein A3A33_05045 [Candidatus Yanofskybacteria bacterium RIFCSPLOWO2_01_FULL_49_25]|uniref:Lactamase n=1 Tax=Candidatus Yanofskybacteria bacterium RIFCSPLOWO2_01_FULL_49_25 TaxID=1802701 RepID=A0A1F8GQ35_9BACT|nr:MAG: hypothetical protein A3A33_05045 [Candidatus Yanofskybacteria bacterium RIFCSPLOWO2_01_FULL_49_25]